MFDNVRRVTRQIAAYGSADVALQFINFLLLPIYTRVLTTEEYGVLTLLLACEAGLKILFRWGLDSAFLRLFYDQSTEEGRRTLAGTIAMVLSAANGVILVALVAAAGLGGAWLGGLPAFRTAFVLLVVNSFISGFFFLPLTLYRAREAPGRVITLTFSRSIATTIVRLVLVLYFRLGVLGIVLADVIVSAAMTLALVPTYRAMVRWRFSRPIAREALRFGLPQVPFGLLHQIMAYADRVLLALLLPGSGAVVLAQVGLYQIGVSIANLLKLLPVAFQNAWLPFAFDTVGKRADAAALFARLATYCLGVLVLLTIGVMTLTDSVVALLLPPSYRGAASVVPVLAIGIAAQAAGWFPTTSLNVAKATRYFPLVTAAAAAAALAGEAALIPRYGVLGAAVGAIVGQLVQAVAILYFAQRVYPIPYERERLVKVVAVGAAVAVLAFQVSFEQPVWTLVGRALVLSTFPLGLMAARLFTASEIRDLRALGLAARTRLRSSAPELRS